MSARHLIGSDVLGSLLIRFKDPEGLVRAKGGGAGALAYKLAPATVEGKIYAETQKEMQKKFAEQGADVDIKIVNDVPQFLSRNDLLTGMAVGAGGLGITYGIFRGLKWLLGRSR